MGRNAHRRIADRDDHRNPDVVRPFETRTLRRLREKMQLIPTRCAFERIVAGASNRDATRKLLEPMLRDNLPCCASFAVTGQHFGDCPARHLTIQ